MSNSHVVLGHIIAGNEWHAVNAAVLDALPSEDGWPHLTRDLFSMAKVEHTYNDTCIVFGCIYNHLEPDSEAWARWQAKFEDLLSQLYFLIAYARLEGFGAHDHLFCWQSLDWYAERPLRKWTFTHEHVPRLKQ